MTVVSPKGIDDAGFANLEAIRYAKWIGVSAGRSGHSSIDEFIDFIMELNNPNSVIEAFKTENPPVCLLTTTVKKEQK